MDNPSDQAMVKAAFRIHHRDGEIEIDSHDSRLPTARVSRGDSPGAYVLAWVWIPYEDVTAEDRK
jgi:hypothetical protein